MLRSLKELKGYAVQAEDGEVGPIESYLFDDKSWVTRYMVVDTGEWLEEISWENEEVQVDLFRDRIKDAPDYDPSAPVNREYETVLYDYYGRPRYWD